MWPFLAASSCSDLLSTSLPFGAVDIDQKDVNAVDFWRLDAECHTQPNELTHFSSWRCPLYTL
jgi:hypothetical protein